METLMIIVLSRRQATGCKLCSFSFLHLAWGRLLCGLRPNPLLFRISQGPCVLSSPLPKLGGGGGEFFGTIHTNDGIKIQKRSKKAAAGPQTIAEPALKRPYLSPPSRSKTRYSTKEWLCMHMCWGHHQPCHRGVVLRQEAEEISCRVKSRNMGAGAWAAAQWKSRGLLRSFYCLRGRMTTRPSWVRGHQDICTCTSATPCSTRQRAGPTTAAGLSTPQLSY